MASSGMDKFDPKQHVEVVKKEWYRKQAVYLNQYNRKSKYPPMQLESHNHERERVPFKMTSEDRALRAQWLNDQHLSPNEPRVVPELRPRNFFRRMFGLPWDVATKAVTPVVGAHKARYFRYLGPKVGMYLFGICATANYFKNNHAGWEAVQGWNIYHNRAPVYPGEPIISISRDSHEKHTDDFNDRGFKNRKVLLPSS